MQTRRRRLLSPPMGDWRLKLRNSYAGDLLYRSLRNRSDGRGWGGFHQDRIYRAMMLELLSLGDFSSFVETGTYRGHSTELIASRFPRLPVFTVEIVEATYRRSRGFLKRYPNVTCILGSSDQAIQNLIAGGKIGNRPLFYLDAHWQNYWPLRNELSHIAACTNPAVIVIDDFEVPAQPQFGFDIDGGGEITAGQKCNLDYIAASLSPERRYQAAFPKYSMSDAFPSGEGPLRGHIVLFQDFPELYERFLQLPMAREHYFPQPIGPAEPLSGRG